MAAGVGRHRATWVSGARSGVVHPYWEAGDYRRSDRDHLLREARLSRRRAGITDSEWMAHAAKRAASDPAGHFAQLDAVAPRAAVEGYTQGEHQSGVGEAPEEGRCREFLPPGDGFRLDVLYQDGPPS